MRSALHRQSEPPLYGHKLSAVHIDSGNINHFLCCYFLSKWKNLMINRENFTSTSDETGHLIALFQLESPPLLCLQVPDQRLSCIQLMNSVVQMSSLSNRGYSDMVHYGQTKSAIKGGFLHFRWRHKTHKRKSKTSKHQKFLCTSLV